ncbi:MAG: hypothetical protein WC942_01490 [Clostridia bacterium]|jgi:hypothetical protein
MNLSEALLTLMFALLYKEAPYIEESVKPQHLQHKEDVTIIRDIYISLTDNPQLESTIVDSAILAAVGFRESRYRQNGPDGDPIYVSGCKGTNCKRGNSIGPHQISKGAPFWVKNWESSESWMFEKWQGINIENLRDPSTNISFSYDLLKIYKNKCGGGPSVWLSSYGAGRCINLKKTSGEVNIRCKIVDGFVDKLSELTNIEKLSGSCKAGYQTAK